MVYVVQCRDLPVIPSVKMDLVRSMRLSRIDGLTFRPVFGGSMSRHRRHWLWDV